MIKSLKTFMGGCAPVVPPMPDPVPTPPAEPDPVPMPEPMPMPPPEPMAEPMSVDMKAIDISFTAFLFFMERGAQDGYALDDWLRAESMVKELA